MRFSQSIGATTLQHGLRWRQTAVALAFTAIASSNPAVAQEKQRRVLFLCPDSDIPAAVAVGEAVRRKLTQPTSFRIETYREFLDLSRFPDAAHKQLTLDYLAQK